MYSVLIADDEVSVCRGLSLLIPWNEYGFEIGGFCKDGRGVLEELEHASYDLLITDIRMPELSGLELLERIDAMDLTIKTIILSAHADFAYAQSAMAHGAIDYLLKPVDETCLIAALKRVGTKLDREQPEQSAVSQSGLSSDLIAAALQLIEASDGRDLTVNTLAAQLFVTPNHLSRVFKARVGSGLNEYIRQARIDKAKALLATPNLMIYEVGSRVGFTDIDYFTHVFKQLTGLTPSAYRAQLYQADNR